MKYEYYKTILSSIKFENSFYSLSRFDGQDWGIKVPMLEGMSMFHLVTEGESVLELENQSYFLTKGDLVFLPRACEHTLKGHDAALSVELFSLPYEKIGQCVEAYDSSSHGFSSSSLMCGVVTIIDPVVKNFLEDMPELFIVKNESTIFGNVTLNLFEQFSKEIIDRQVGVEIIASRLADILVIQCVQSWIKSCDSLKIGKISSSIDSRVNCAIKLIHERPGHSWTIEQLGKEVGMSRTAFSARFKEVLGLSVHNYITIWRMKVAYDKIVECGALNIDQIESLGYNSESAFRRAFKRTFGKSIKEVKQSKLVPFDQLVLQKHLPAHRVSSNTKLAFKDQKV